MVASHELVKGVEVGPTTRDGGLSHTRTQSLTFIGRATPPLIGVGYEAAATEVTRSSFVETHRLYDNRYG